MIKKYISINLLSIITLISVILFWKKSILLTAILLIIGFLMLYILKSKKKIIVFIFCSFAGALTEIIAIYSGAWIYSNSNFLGIPFWLIPLWGIAALFMINLDNQINNLIK